MEPNPALGEEVCCRPPLNCSGQLNLNKGLYCEIRPVHIIWRPQNLGLKKSAATVSVNLDKVDVSIESVRAADLCAGVPDIHAAEYNSKARQLCETC